MAYELATLADAPANVPQQAQSGLREERVISSFSDVDARYARALAKMQGNNVEINAPVINDKALTDEPVKSGGSLPLSPQLAALARKEQKFRQEQQALKAKELALEAERKEYAELKALKTKLAANDYSDIDKLVDYEKLVQHKLGKDSKADELENIRSEMAKLKEAQEKDLEGRYNSAVNQRRTAVKSLIESSDEFRAIKAKDAGEAVVQLILDTWEEDEIELPVEDAAKEVEKELRARAQTWAEILQEKKAESEVVEKKELPQLKPAMKTLTNNMAATGEPKRPVKPLHMMTENERYQEARRRYEEKLKQGLR